MDHCFHKNMKLFSTLIIIINVSDHYIVISEWSCDTEDWSKDDKFNFDHRNKLHLTKYSHRKQLMYTEIYLKSSDAKASKCHLKFSSRMLCFIKLVYLSSVISLKWQLIGNLHPHLSEINELNNTSLIKMIILEENFKWHLEAFASELFIYCFWSNNYSLNWWAEETFVKTLRNLTPQTFEW